MQDELENRTNELDENKKLLDEKDKELKKAKSIVNNNINNVNVNNVNIHINAYGNENLSFLTEMRLKKILGGMKNNVIPRLIRDLHCNPELPENMNVFRPNKKDNHFMIFDGNRWMLDSGSKVINQLIADKINLIDDLLYQKGASKDNIEKLEMIQEDGTTDNDIIDQISTDLYNNKSILFKNSV